MKKEPPFFLEKQIQGIAASPGIAIGVPVFASLEEMEIPEYFLSTEEVEKEIDHFHNALEESKKEISSLQRECLGEEKKEIVSILDAHLQILKDPLITKGIKEEIRQVKKNSAHVFSETMGALKNRLQSSSDQVFQERAQDVSDIYKRVLSHLLPRRNKKSPFIEAILVTPELTPSIAIEIKEKRVGFISQLGGTSSHAAIIARAKKIPYVTGISIADLQRENVQNLIIDGFEGKIILNPTKETEKKYKKIKKEKESYFLSLKKEAHRKAQTVDGKNLCLMANIDSWEDLASFKQYEVEGVGLFRGEYLLFSEKHLLPEKEQVEAYERLVYSVPSKDPIVIRLFDLGGDKPFFPVHKEEQNPALGCRGIRLLLKEPFLLKTQLRALLRANVKKNIHLLVPMLSEIDEIRKVKAFLEEEKRALQEEKIPFYPISQMGAMLEIPSSALLCKEFCKEVDFISIGSNDLIQHILGVDRSNPFVASLHNPLHPAFLRVIKDMVLTCKEQKKRLIFCGEMVSKPFYIPILLGMDLINFSLSLSNIPLFKQIVRGLSAKVCKEIAEKAMQIASSEELLQYVTKSYEKEGIDTLFPY